ncbi:DUF6261 family protein [Hoylesella enoeca]|uniref:Uncharacterized protein n=1 Tax=Hoylesella enoeca TaxID=76123 RepID=A0A0S2KKZ9_9BACT|nr:DUF6261 family protein [Hoylesella enoeca]ALO48985.1 hypothetical protein AS203_07750 [Hoylesella enoeca]
MKLKDFMRSRLQNMEHYQFADRVLQLCKEANVPKLTAVLGPLTAAVAKEDLALNQPRVLDGTEELELLDNARDNAYYALSLLVEMQKRSEDKATIAAAKVLAEVMSRYPRAAAENYDKETGMIKNLITDLNAAPAAAAVTKLGALAAVRRLDRTNKEFDTRFHTRIKAGSASLDVKELRTAVDRALDAVLLRINSLNDLEPSAPITKLIEQYNTLVANRQTLLSGRVATNKARTEKQLAELRKELEPLIRKFEEANGIAPNVLTFTGKTKGTGKSKAYELAYSTDPKRTMWVVREKDELKEVKG